MSTEPWNVDTKTDAVTALQAAYDDLVDALDCATEMDDHTVEEHIEKAQEIVNDLVSFLELKR